MSFDGTSGVVPQYPQLHVRSAIVALLRHVPNPSRNGLVDTKSGLFLLKKKGINKANYFLQITCGFPVKSEKVFICFSVFFCVLAVLDA